MLHRQAAPDSNRIIRTRRPLTLPIGNNRLQLHFKTARANSFNPRPPSLAGVPTARPRGRAGRCCFNPRPPSLAGVPRADAVGARRLLFQSAPAIAGGRSVARHDSMPAPDCFNPRPPSLAGVPLILARPVVLAVVSIRARHRWRAFLQLTGNHRNHSGFNPRPPSLAGVPPSLAGRHQPWLVSIRARHRWRAFQGNWFKLWFAGDVSIRARHRWRAFQSVFCSRGRCLDVSIRARHRWRAFRVAMGGNGCAMKFQSAPAIAGGRSLHSKHTRRSSPVSIRARHRWRAFLFARRCKHAKSFSPALREPPADVETAPERNAQSEKFIGKTTRYEGREPMGNPAIASGSR